MAGSENEPRLNYAGPATRRAAGLLAPLHLALACGLFPAASGTLIITGWLWTRFPAFETLGLVNIVLGLLFTLAGAIALFTHLARAFGTERRAVRTRLLRFAATVILLGNFPLCGFYIWVAHLYTVAVFNSTGANVNSFVVNDPTGQAWELGPIPISGSAQRMLDMEGAGGVAFTAKGNGTVISGEIDGYIGGGETGAHWTVTLNADGTYSVR